MDNTIKSLFKKIGEGLLIGIGAGITAGLLFAIVNKMMYRNVFNDEAMKYIKIIEHHELEHNGVSSILGTLKNNSDENIRSFQIKVDLFDKTGKFVEQCEDYQSLLSAKKETKFKVTCKSCDSNKTVEHDSYKIYINDY